MIKRSRAPLPVSLVIAARVYVKAGDEARVE